MRLPQVPKDRVIDATPVALSLILISLLQDATYVGLALLHLWLWLRHPRSKSRYWVFAAAVSLYLGHFVGLPLLIDYVGKINSPFKCDAWQRVSMYMLIASATGILPIAYRLISRCSLTYRGEQQDDDDASDSRAGISDLIFLSLLCAVALFSARIPEFAWDYYWSPSHTLLVTLYYSALAIAAMRMGASGSRTTGVVVFLVTWIVGYIGCKFLLLGVGVVSDELLDDPYWLTPRNASRYHQPSFIGAFFVGLFPSICRKCGVTLRIPRPSVANSAVFADTSSQPAQREHVSRWSRVGRILGSWFLLVSLLILVLHPFGTIGRYDSDGYRVAGWPLRYLEQDQVNQSSAPLIWTESDTWATVDFSVVSLILNLLIAIAIWLIFLPPKRLKQLVSAMTLRRVRITTSVCLVILILMSTHGIYWLRMIALRSQEGVRYHRFEQYPKLGSIASLADKFDSAILPSEYRIKRGRPTSVTLSESPPSVITHVLGLPVLHDITLRRCRLLPEHVEQLATHQNLESIELEDCELSPDAVQRLLAVPQLVDLQLERTQGEEELIRITRLDSYYGRRDSDATDSPRFEMALSRNGGDISVPQRVSELTILAPYDIDCEFQIRSAPDLQVLQISSMSVKISEAVTRLTIMDAPALESVFLSNSQKVDLEIESAESVHTISGIPIRGLDPFARLTALRFHRPTRLEKLFIDISQCTEFTVGGRSNGQDSRSGDEPQDASGKVFVEQLRLAGLSGVEHRDDELSNENLVTSWLEFFPEQIDATYLSVERMSISQEALELLPSCSETLRFIDCRVAADTFDHADESVPSTRRLIAPDYSPDDVQLATLLKKVPSLSGIHISGRKLTTIPRALARDIVQVTIDDLSLNGDDLMGLAWPDVLKARFWNLKVSDEVFQSWKMPSLEAIDLAGSSVSIEAFALFAGKSPSLNSINLETEATSEYEDYEKEGKIFLSGRRITSQDLKSIVRLRCEMVDFQGCEISPATLREIEQDTSEKYFILD
ncbi:hypothetical protein [Stieleria varia]|uniref:Leucine Rich repeats (2 copies) n=1 Tax=Stieleria varia TaxID=2528005 RepID=A0A5C6B8H2_9BACT|nr:hypothetical protein [Stieleria varia]TWU08565.1 hypothetical protein Pla52n_11480 [Stieleria varia]